MVKVLIIERSCFNPVCERLMKGTEAYNIGLTIQFVLEAVQIPQPKQNPSKKKSYLLSTPPPESFMILESSYSKNSKCTITKKVDE